MYNLIEYSDNYSKISGNLWQYYSNKPALNANSTINNNNNSVLFELKTKLTGKTKNDDTNDVTTVVVLMYLSNFGVSLYR